jgi:hypothetical protein
MINTNEFYKFFDFDYNKRDLLEIFQNSLKVKKLTYSLAENLPVDKLPFINVFDRSLSSDEYGLAELLTETGLHTNPKNNGLLVFPVNGLIQFDFLKCKIDITTPTAINGRQLHNYKPLESSSIFFAIKIPYNVSWEQVINLI